ncbi:Ribonuclease Z [Seminavis robusta]|uniref:Ribonuclease Z n=1 Tax=Seminavis robusta TaxID=568900 RepID=A0A9N8HRK1_9STRA|nr:Ribonuclease Z [Seminavis robusta]|eukprot:Sro1330_g263430.1 Ribonuclease Z (476) ;mRNA; f:20498-22136
MALSATARRLSKLIITAEGVSTFHCTAAQSWWNCRHPKRRLASSSSSFPTDHTGTTNGSGTTAFATGTAEDEWADIDATVAPYVKSCLPSEDEPKDNRKRWDTQFHIHLLGTGAGTSTHRMPACTVVRLGAGDGLVFDAGEGSRIQVKKSIVKMKTLSRFFITHLHADHVLGLPSLLLTVAQAGPPDEDSVIQVYGPPGLYNFVVANLALTHSSLGRTTVEVFELVGGQCRVHWQRRAMTGSFPAFRHDNVVRKTLRCDEDGLWKVKVFQEITRETDNRAMDYQITAGEVYHVPHVPTFGYVIEEQQPLPRIDVERAESLGVESGVKFKLLKNGFAVMDESGKREVKPEEITVKSPFKARKVAILGDTCGIPPPMARLCQNVDVLLHEATMLNEEKRSLGLKRGHSTAAMAGEFADAVNADLLVLNHLNHSGGMTQQAAREAEGSIKGGTRVVSALDFMELAIPREGFKFGGNPL